jgi:hypothetical protein
MNLVEVSQKPLDLPFISRVLRTNRLNCNPLQGFYNDPSTWAEDANWKRTIERYEWGVIVFLANHQAQEHRTLIIRGSFDPDKGEATDDGHAQSLQELVPWYKDLAKALKGKVETHVDIKIPDCLGYHEDDAGTDNPICDGGYVPARNVAEKPCAWRGRCIPFQAHSVSLGRTPQEVKHGLSPEQIVQLTTKLADEAAATAVPTPQPIAAAAPSTTQPKATPSSKPAVKAAAPVIVVGQKAAPAPPAGGVALFWDVFNSLKQKVSDRKFITGREEAQAGDIFVQDRGTSGYMSLYCEPVSGRRIAIVEIRLKSDKVHALFPFPADHKLLTGLKASPAKDGKFISLVADIPKSVSIERLTNLLAQAITSGVIQLPSQDRKAVVNA